MANLNEILKMDKKTNDIGIYNVFANMRNFMPKFHKIKIQIKRIQCKFHTELRGTTNAKVLQT